jgi:hypothetical protein
MSGQWSVASLSLPRYGYAVATVGSQVLFAGGAATRIPEGSDSRFVPLVDIYDTTPSAPPAGTVNSGRTPNMTGSVIDTNFES